MPCYDNRSEPDYVRAEAKKEFQADLDKLTRLLCEACGLLNTLVGGIPASYDELREWYKEHKKLDRARGRS